MDDFEKMCRKALENFDEKKVVINYNKYDNIPEDMDNCHIKPFPAS